MRAAIKGRAFPVSRTNCHLIFPWKLTGIFEANSSVTMKGTNMKKTLVIAALVSALGFTVGCDNEGPAERAGESIDRDSERVRDKVEDAGEKTGRELERAGEKMQDAAQDAKRELNDATR